jgi:prepilin signal peptidase PulO-like enzyme (type II secretory pathway)
LLAVIKTSTFEFEVRTSIVNLFPVITFTLMVIALNLSFDLEKSHICILSLFSKLLYRTSALIFLLIVTFLSIEVQYLQELIPMLLHVFPHLQAQITAYVDYFGQCTSEHFPDDISEVDSL